MKVLDRFIPAIAQTVLKQFGTDAILLLHPETVFDPGTLSSEVPDPVEVPVQIVLEAKRFAQIAEALGLETIQDRQALFAAKDLPRDPVPGDAFLVGEQELEIVDLDPVFSGDLVAIWVAGIKR